MGAVRRRDQRRRRRLTLSSPCQKPPRNSRGFSFAAIGWITASPVSIQILRETMTDKRALLRAIFETAVAAAHPDKVLSAHLRPIPQGRVICLAAGKAAAAMAAAAERYYLDQLG